VMRAAEGQVADGPTISPQSAVSEAAPLFGQGNGWVRVVDPGGRPVGVLEREVVIDLMMQG
jgi:hypothetical protein